MDTKIPPISTFVHWLQKLTPEGAQRLSLFATPDVHVRTPAGEAMGIAAAGNLYGSLFEGYDTVKIRVIDTVPAADGYSAFVRWDMLKVDFDQRTHALSGMTELMVGLDGKIVSIVEYWDRAPAAASPPTKSWWARLLKN